MSNVPAQMMIRKIGWLAFTTRIVLLNATQQAKPILVTTTMEARVERGRREMSLKNGILG